MEIVLSIVGILVAIVTFYFSYYSKPTEELNNLKAQFRVTQQLSKSVQNNIEEYANRMNSWEHPIFEGITFRAYLNQMKKSYEENLSNKLFNELSRLKLTKANIESMTKSLESQQSALLQIQTEAKIRLNQLPNH